MDYQELLRVLQALESGQKDERLGQLFKGFKELLELQLEHNNLMNQNEKPSMDSLKTLVSKMTANLDQLQAKYRDFCEKSGKSPEEMKEYFSNPKNFSTGAWEELQNFNRKFGVDTASRQIPKKKKRRKKVFVNI
ncbi:hypothetical protein [Simkania negevensis]|uniref:Uncharacterized protein n=1 Tax=Simkania negevensis (strain ATCC VR-1471 / DSM 27360 / Z) TaxID=331113 RepID=F8L3I7_SIMNZ|nr:hypothetical protein [Simkania negevensis]CCB89846.1 unknown protein [Simkania negevensis Z]